MKITITKFPKHRTSTIGAWKYWHLIQYKEDGYKYDLTMTDEGMMYLIKALEATGNTVNFIVKE